MSAAYVVLGITGEYEYDWWVAKAFKSYGDAANYALEAETLARKICEERKRLHAAYWELPESERAGNTNWNKMRDAQAAITVSPIDSNLQIDCDYNNIDYVVKETELV